MSFVPLIPTQQAVLSGLYQLIFPEISDMNGVFGEKALWYGLSLGEQLIAFYTIGQVNENRIFVYNIGVNPVFRQKGYGHQLMEHLIQMYGDKEIYLFVNKENRVAIKLYKSFQFDKVNREYVPPINQICMKREKRVKFH